MIATVPSLSRIFRRVSSRTRRAHERFPCMIPGQIVFVERGFSIDGVVNQVSAGGLRVRPALTYILGRRGGANVLVKFGSFSLEAALMNTTEYGYGLRLNSTLSQDDLEEILELSKSSGMA